MPLTGSGDFLSWSVFGGVVLGMLALDLGVFHKKSHEISVKEAVSWSVVWVALALAFGAGLWWRQGSGPGLEFLTAYLVEKSLSVDNIFVFVMVFSAFGIPAVRQHRVLFWGVLGALALRGGFIVAGAALLERFHWMLYVFGGLLAVTGLKMLLFKAEAEDPSQSAAVRLARRFIPATDKLHGDAFLIMENGRRVATPLAMSLAAVEGADVVFAVDSIPAVFAVTLDPFIVYTSNVFAILGLRSMYFVLAGVVDK
ncbi:MAG: tellurite resistance protein TerC, partial [Elusimicrobia bacterium]